MSNTGEKKFQGSNLKIMGHNIPKCAFLAIRVALGGP